MHLRNERRQIRVLIRTIFVVFVLIAAFIAWIIFQPPPIRPQIAFHLNGYTNDLAGNRHAILTITNNTRAAPVVEITPAMTALLSRNTLTFDIVFFIIAFTFLIQGFEQIIQSDVGFLHFPGHLIGVFHNLTFFRNKKE